MSFDTYSAAQHKHTGLALFAGAGLVNAKGMFEGDPAVIPALIAYVKVVAVKTLVVGFRLSDTSAWNQSAAPVKGTLATGKGGRRSNVLQAVSSESQGYGFRAVVRLGVPFTVTKLA